MQPEASNTDLDELLRRYPWEHDPARLSWEASRHTIVSKLLQVGGWDAVRWLRSHLTDDELREFLVRRRGRGLDPKRLRFWQLILDLPADQVDAWIAAARANPWEHRSGVRDQDSYRAKPDSSDHSQVRGT